MRTSRIALIGVPVILMLGLTACDSGGGGSEDDGEIVGGSPTECVTGLWDADVADLATQMGEHLTAKGLPIISSTGSGSQQLSLDEQGYAGFASTGLQLVITADLENDLILTVTQTHNGSMRADWGWDSDTVFGFTNITDEGYQVDTVADINGTVTEYPLDIPLGGMSDVPLAVTCEGDTMTTKAEQSPFTTTWHRVGDAVVFE
jgi:hypothetical protein